MTTSGTVPFATGKNAKHTHVGNPRDDKLVGRNPVQKGKVYLKDASWWFRFKTPLMRNGKKVWRDRYERLAPAAAFDSVAQVRKSGLLAQFRDDLDTTQMTPSMMLLVNDFVDKIYFPH